MASGPSPLRHFHVGVEGLAIHVAEGGAEDRPGLLFLHGWPQDWSAFTGVMAALQDDARVVAIDLPGIGLSERSARANDKRTLAFRVHGVIESLGLRDLTLVGHDIGAQIVYAYLRAFPGALQGAALMSGAIPGVEPWSRTSRNPKAWHLAFHAIPGLPEALVSGHRSAYFDYFFDALSGPAGISARARAAYSAAYASPAALHTGFEWFRTFPKDERDNLAVRGEHVDTPVLVLRGEHEGGNLADHIAGLRDSGFTDVQGEIVRRSGHFVADEQPAAVADLLRRFVAARARQTSPA